MPVSRSTGAISPEITSFAMTTPDCIYATSGWGIHDERWVAALLEQGFTPHVISLGRDVADALELREAVLAASGPGSLPVLAGPLHNVTRPLADLPLRVIGLSWGYDLSDLDAQGSDLTWLRSLQGVIVDSEANRRIALSAGVDSSAITFLPWGVDLDTFAFHGPWIDAFLLGVPPHARLVLSLRAHEPIYRVADIIRAFAAIRRDPDAHEDFPDPYLIVGHSGSQTGELKELAHALNIDSRVRWIGSVPEVDLVPLLGRGAAYVTAAQVDGTSVTMLQAMACGTPVIASETPGNLGWIEDGVTGYTFPTGDIERLTHVLTRVLATYPVEVTERARALVVREANWHANLARLGNALRL